MRKIGELSSREHGPLLGAYLFSVGIENQIDQGDGDVWSVWVISDEKLDEARSVLQEFLADPDDPRYAAAVKKAQSKLAEEQAKEKRYRRNYHDRNQLFKGIRIGLVTAFLIGLSVLVTVVSNFGETTSVTDHVFFTSVEYRDGWIYFDETLPEVRSGEVWRLLLPIFLHLDFLHLLFNMMWTADLGALIERRHGSLRLLAFVIAVGVVSNTMQFVVSGPLFGGMSGVVYGLLGYLWIRAKTDPFYDIHINKNTLLMMGVWFLLCMTPLINAANMAHGAGLAAGMLVGYVAGIVAKRRRFDKVA